MPVFRAFAELCEVVARLPDETSIFRLSGTSHRVVQPFPECASVRTVAETVGVSASSICCER